MFLSGKRARSKAFLCKKSSVIISIQMRGRGDGCFVNFADFTKKVFTKREKHDIIMSLMVRCKYALGFIKKHVLQCIF